MASQRSRLLEATLEAIGTHGFAEARIAHITSGARVSRSTFYEQFDDKRDAFLQAYDDFAASFLERLFEVSSSAVDAIDAVQSSSALLVAWLTERPPAARAWLIEIYALGDAGLRRRAATMRSVEGAFDLAARWIRRTDAALPEPAPMAGRAVVAASFELLVDAIVDPRAAPVEEVCAAISEWWMLGLTTGRYDRSRPGRSGPAE